MSLLVLYSVISSCRSLLEPRLVGARWELLPTNTLNAAYVCGFQALRFLGMLLAPLTRQVLGPSSSGIPASYSLFGP